MTQEELKYCERCDSVKTSPQVLSRRTNAYICSECAEEEALIDAGQMKETKNEKVFLSKLGKKINPNSKEIAIFIQQKRFERFSEIVGNANENKREEKYMKKLENKKVRISLTPNGEFIFPYLTDRECYGVKQVAETVKIFPNYKIAELQHWSGLSEQDFMKALYWLDQYEFVQSWYGHLNEIIPKELAKMGVIL